MKFSKYITMKRTCDLVEKQLNKLKVLDIEYNYDNAGGELGAYYDDFGNYDMFYVILSFTSPEPKWRDILNDIQTKYIKFERLSKVWSEFDVYDISLGWIKNYRINVQISFDKVLYFKNNKNKLLSNSLKSILDKKRTKEFD